MIERAQLRAAPAGHVVAHVGRFTEYGGRRVYRVVARAGEWLGVLAPERPNGRAGWIRADARRARRDALARSSWTARRGGSSWCARRRVVRRMLVTVGAPSSPTPLGRFAVTDKLWMERGSVYGCCALALSGSQTPGASPACGWRSTARARREQLGLAASNGCARATARDLHWLMRTVPRGTPVTVVR